jgi:hypothetical protein
MTSALVALVCLGALGPVRTPGYQRCRHPWRWHRNPIGLCAPAGHLAAWCRRRLARLVSWPSPRGPVPRCCYCEGAAVYGHAHHQDGTRSRLVVYLCDDLGCEARRPLPYDLGAWPSESLAPVGVAREEQLLGERALLRGDWHTAAYHDREVKVWRLLTGVLRLREAHAAKVAAREAAKKKLRGKRAKPASQASVSLRQQERRGWT